MRMPVRLRLTLAFAVVMAAVLAAAGLFVHQRLQSSLNHGIDTALHSRSADVAALAQQSDTGLSEARRTNAIERRAQLAQIFDGRGRIIDQTAGLPRRALLPAATLAQARGGRTTTLDARLPGVGSVRLLAIPVRAQGQELVVVVGQSLEDRDRALSGLTGVLLIGGPAALVLASIAGYFLIGGALRPVEAMRRRAAVISASELDSRLPPAGGNDELGRLGRTLNEMLARIQESVARERTFVADASHELRTPLAMVRTELELMARDRPSGPALQRAARSAIEETDRLSRLADDLLLLTRADHGEAALRMAKTGAGELLDDAAERARRRMPPGGVQIGVEDPEQALVLADRDRVAQALDNMLANALRYAQADVGLAALARGKLVELHVVDDGPGFPADFLPRAWERFARADAGRTEDGAGLGLAIVRTIADLHGGEVHAENRPGGGADVWIGLPRAGEPTGRSGAGQPPAAIRRQWCARPPSLSRSRSRWP